MKEYRRDQIEKFLNSLDKKKNPRIHKHYTEILKKMDKEENGK